MSDPLMEKIKELEREIKNMKVFDVPRSTDPTWIYPNDSRWVGTQLEPLTAGAWTAALLSTTGVTTIDLSAVFGVPAKVKAVLVRVTLRDSASAGGDYPFNLRPVGGASVLTVRCSGLVNNSYTNGELIVPCDANGDIAYSNTASGVNTMTVTLQIWGYAIGG